MNQIRIRKWLFLSLLLVALFVLCAVPSGGAASTRGGGPDVQAYQDSLRCVTMQISLYHFRQTTQETWIEADGRNMQQSTIEYLVEMGLGTLIQHTGSWWVITHDHWDLSQTPDKVLFHDAWGEALLEISGEDFTAHIRYRDRGTLVLEAPPLLVSMWINASLLELCAGKSFPPLELGEAGEAKVGQVVYVAHRGADQGIGIFQARVLAVEYRGALPVYRLITLGGGLLAPGDSGGGIWLDRHLVGNNFSIEFQRPLPGPEIPDKLSTEPTGISFAAGLPELLK